MESADHQCILQTLWRWYRKHSCIMTSAFVRPPLHQLPLSKYNFTYQFVFQILTEEIQQWCVSKKHNRCNNFLCKSSCIESFAAKSTTIFLLHDEIDDGHFSFFFVEILGRLLKSHWGILIFVHALILESLQTKVNSNNNFLEVGCQKMQLNCPLINNWATYFYNASWIETAM